MHNIISSFTYFVSSRRQTPPPSRVSINFKQFYFQLVTPQNSSIVLMTTTGQHRNEEAPVTLRDLGKFVLELKVCFYDARPSRWEASQREFIHPPACLSSTPRRRPRCANVWIINSVFHGEHGDYSAGVVKHASTWILAQRANTCSANPHRLCAEI